MQWLKVIGPALLFIAVFLGGGQLQSKFSRRVDVAGQQPLFRRFGGYSAQDVNAYWTALGPAGQGAERTFLILDLFFPVLYGGVLIWALWFYWDASGGEIWGIGFHLAALAAILVVLSDWTENTTQLIELGRFMEGYPLRSAAVGLASTATLIKLWLGLGCLGLLLLGAGSMATRAFK